MLIAGCFSKPPRPLEGDAKIDPDGNSGPACTNPPVEDNFDNTFTASPCGDGFPDGDPNSIITRTGVLEMALMSGLTETDASCSWDMRFDDGAFVEVRRTLGEGPTYTILQVNVGAIRVGLSVFGESQLFLFDDSQDPKELVELVYDRTEMKWWRLRPEGGLVIGEYSSDGKAWTRIGASVAPAPTDVTQVHLNAGAFAPLVNPARAEFDDFNICRQ